MAPQPTLSAISENGTRIDVCAVRCDHDDCHVRHAAAHSYCGLCHSSIGYNLRYHSDQRHGDGYIHSFCLAEVVEATVPSGMIVCDAQRPERELLLKAA